MRPTKEVSNYVYYPNEWSVFAGKTLSGEHIQLFLGSHTGVWLLISAGPKKGEGCSLGGGEESVSLIANLKVQL